jgi:hypothetical protein
MKAIITALILATLVAAATATPSATAAPYGRPDAGFGRNSTPFQCIASAQTHYARLLRAAAGTVGISANCDICSGASRKRAS